MKYLKFDNPVDNEPTLLRDELPDQMSVDDIQNLLTAARIIVPVGDKWGYNWSVIRIIYH